MNQTAKMFQPLFEEQLRLPRNASCKVCDPEIKCPLLPWLVGDQFQNTRERVVFVGKPHRGTPGNVLPSGVIDPTADVGGSDGLWNYPWAYWSYTRAIAEQLYGDDAFRSVAFTNIIKCTNSHNTDRTTPTMAHSCITKLGVIWEEFRILKPLTVIFYTYNLYRDLLTSIPIAKPGTIQEVTRYDHRVSCGAKMLGWWERRCESLWGDRIRILVVGHPERMKKEEYVNRLVEWVREDSYA